MDVLKARCNTACAAAVALLAKCCNALIVLTYEGADNVAKCGAAGGVQAVVLGCCAVTAETGQAVLLTAPAECYPRSPLTPATMAKLRAAGGVEVLHQAVPRVSNAGLMAWVLRL